MSRIDRVKRRCAVAFVLGMLPSCGGGDDTNAEGSATFGSMEGPSGDGTTNGVGNTDSSGPGVTTAGGSAGTGGSGDASSSDSGSGDANSGSPEASGSSDAGESSGDDPTTPSPEGRCPTFELEGPLPATVEGTTLGAGSAFGGTCGGAQAPDGSVVFTAPHDGSFAFDTLLGCPLSEEFGPLGDTPVCEMDPVLYVLDGECAGTELACSDDSFGMAAVVGADLVQGQRVTVVVDGVGTDGGDFVLRASDLKITCPVAELGPGAPAEADVQTAIATNLHTASCDFSVQGKPDSLLTFEAATAGSYTFSAVGPLDDVTVFVLDGTCGGAEIGCDTTSVSVPLAAGQTVTVGVEYRGKSVGDIHVEVDGP